MNNEELLAIHPELDYIRRWTEAFETENYEEALSILGEGLKVAKKRKSRPIVKHLRELQHKTQAHLALARSNQEGINVFENEARIRCSFCGKKRAHVVTMIAGAKGHICNECVEICSQIIAAESQSCSKTKE